MKKTAILLALCLLLYACAAAEPQLTPHELAMQKLIADAPLWAGEGVRLDLHQDERLPVLAAPFFPMTEVDPGPYRGANDRAEVSLNEPFTVLASTPFSGESWLLISYEIRGDANRIGWIVTPEAIAPDCVPAANRDEATLRVRRDTIVTDDPFGSRRVLDRIKRDEEVECIGWAGKYAYVRTVINDRFAFGFVPLADLEDPNTVRMEDAKAWLVGAWRFSGGAEILGDGIVFDENGRYMLCRADNWEAFPPEGLRLCVGSTGKYEAVKNDKPVGGKFWNKDAPFAIVLGGSGSRNGKDKQRYICQTEAGGEEERILLTFGEGGSYYSRMRNDEGEALLKELTGMRIFPLPNFSNGRVNGRASVSNGYLRVHIELTEARTVKQIWLFSGNPNENGEVFGEATPVEGEEGIYAYEGELPEGCTSVYFLTVEEDGSESSLLDIAW